MLRARKPAHIRADLRDEDFGGTLPDTRNGIQEGDGLLVRRQPLRNGLTDTRNRLIQILQGTQVLRQQEALVRRDPPFQGPLALLTLGPETARARSAKTSTSRSPARIASNMARAETP